LDGRVAFACSTNNIWNLCLADQNGQTAVPLLTDLNQADSTLTVRVAPSWSKDGQWLAYMAIGPNNDWDIWLYSLALQRSFNLTATKLVSNQLQPRWSK
jgi:Tol biopolymer transport system component